MSTTDINMIKNILAGKDSILATGQFIEVYEDELESFCVLMEKAFISWSKLDKILTKTKKEEKAYISALLYAFLHSELVSMKLLISGLIVPAGNTQRYALECIALAFLCSRPSLGVIQRYMSDKYSPNKAIRDLIRNHKKLNINREVLKTLEGSSKFYDNLSHPSPLTLSALLTLEGKNSQLLLGGSYDSKKEFVYKKEIQTRINLAEVNVEIIDLVEHNYRIEA